MARTEVGETKMKLGCADTCSSSNCIPEKLCWGALYFLYLQSKKKKKLLIFYEPTTTKRDLVQLSLLLTHVSVIFSFKYILLILHSAHSYELRHNLDTSKP